MPSSDKTDKRQQVRRILAERELHPAQLQEVRGAADAPPPPPPPKGEWPWQL